MEMEHEYNHYGMSDLRHLMISGNLFAPSLLHNNISQPQLFSGTHEGYKHQIVPVGEAQQLEMLLSSSRSQVSGRACPHNSGGGDGANGGGSSSCLSGGDHGFGFDTSAGNGSGRWPRQETLTLLEVRSRLHSKFKDANHKAPLWDQVSRIMCEEYGYQRNGKKCREKFENLYKYYKKTKEGKAGRQDGKHYRFFRQLEALCGESTTTLPIQTGPHQLSINYPSTSTQPNNQEIFHQQPTLQVLCENSLTPSNSSLFYTSSDEHCCSEQALNNAAHVALKRTSTSKRNWTAKIRDFLDGKMRKLMEKQEECIEKMMKSMEHNEHERMLQEQEWRKQEAARIDREHKIWAKDRALMESRDVALMEALQRLNEVKDLRAASCSTSLETVHDHQELTVANHTVSDSWQECEVERLLQLRTSMEPLFVEHSEDNEVLWEHIESNMACFGYANKSAAMCKDKWDSISSCLTRNKDHLLFSMKKHKQNVANSSVSSSCFYLQNNESICNNLGGVDAYRENNIGGPELTRSIQTQNERYNNTNASGRPLLAQGSSFRFFMGDQTENFWGNYGVELSKQDT